ncbi:hypothetical protein SNE35_31240 [Paucibacter sp. R3-3]|uniref:Linalool dehydratase/isomerase domain-containing protein n=1 Tax=Roseateles agri TaxID=3098619 RepID=A0ABU5DRR4_9BURK|nr:hypothetical protein [Paucibacter sp. R3-3]MDY0749015.1 hypothetical protein [Paucibacter sp. R3-3]
MNADLPVRGLDTLQRGHVRHFDNLSRLPPNDWSLMGGRSIGQDDFGAYRFQLAYMAYAVALTYIHRMPAAPGLFKPLFRRLFDKLLLPEVWMYWRDVSRGGSIFNRHLTARYQEEWDPVRRDNIMYSAYVQSLALLYSYLFDDDALSSPGAITFKHWSYFWGGEPKAFAYDEHSLNDHLYWLMVESGYLGVPCEPNCIFQICNQPALLGFRLHDLRYGGNRAQEVTDAYEAAWRQFGRIGDNGHYHVMLAADTLTVRPNLSRSPWVDAWCGALMNMWNRDFVRDNYPRQIAELVKPGMHGTLSVHPPQRPEVMGERIVSDDCDFGWVAAWAAEMGDEETLQGLLGHADRFMRPTWSRGGLYYPRNDQAEDGFGNRTLVEPHTGNVLLGYARLNVRDGLWHLYNDKLDAAFHTRPALTEVGVDVELHAAWFHCSALRFRMSLRGQRDDEVVVGRLNGRGAWVLVCDGRVMARGSGYTVQSSDSPYVVAGEAGISIRCPSTGVHEFELCFS